MKCKKNFKDIESYRIYRERYKTRYRARTGAFRYKMRNWNKEEDNLVLEHSMPDRELSEKIKRSVSAIQKRRSELKKGLCNG